MAKAPASDRGANVLRRLKHNGMIFVRKNNLKHQASMDDPEMYNPEVDMASSSSAQIFYDKKLRIVCDISHSE